jgi:ATP-dependent Lon protease
MVTSMVSALSGIPVKSNVAMTGEITLHGKVLPIGGLKEKTMAAFKSGMDTVIIPAENKGDLSEIDETVKTGLHFICAEKIEDVLNAALDNNASDNESNSELIGTIMTANESENTVAVCS